MTRYTPEQALALGAKPIDLPELGARKSHRHDEYALHVKIVEHHRIYYPNTLLMHVPNQTRSKQEAFWGKKLGVHPGAPDLLIFHDKGCIGIEVKSAEGQQSMNQKTFAFLFKRLNHNYAVVRSVKEYHHALIGFGVMPMLDECRYFNEPCYGTKDDKINANFDMYRPL